VHLRRIEYNTQSSWSDMWNIVYRCMRFTDRAELGLRPGPQEGRAAISGLAKNPA